MSYILDALKESQQARSNEAANNTGEAKAVPDLRTLHPPAVDDIERTGFSRLVMGGLFLVLIFAGAGAGWWFAGRQSQPVVLEEMAVSQPVVGLNAGPAFGIEPLQQPEPPATASTREGEILLEGQRLDARLREHDEGEGEHDEGEDEHDEGEDEHNDGEGGHDQEEGGYDEGDGGYGESQGGDAERLSETIEEESMVAEDLPVAEGVQGVELLQSESPQPEPLEPKVAVKEPPVAVSAVPQPKVPARLPEIAEPSQPRTQNPELKTPPQVASPPHFRELPYDIQQALPPLTYSVHLYSPNPASRMVKIEGLVRREGDEVGSGLILDEITPDGAIFTYRDYRFRVPVN